MLVAGAIDSHAGIAPSRVAMVIRSRRAVSGEQSSSPVMPSTALREAPRRSPRGAYLFGELDMSCPAFASCFMSSQQDCLACFSPQSAPSLQQSAAAKAAVDSDSAKAAPLIENLVMKKLRENVTSN